MADRSTSPAPEWAANGPLSPFIDVLIRVASGDLAARVDRDGSGDLIDVLSYLVNATVEEVGALVEELRQRHDELELAHAQLLHSAKLAALGGLAGGIAHELNQPLTAMRALLDLLRRDAGPQGVIVSPEDMKLLDAVHERMSRTVDGVRSFARHGTLQRRLVPARRALDSALGLMSSQLAQSGIEVACEIALDGITLDADAARLEQVFVNLLANAADAVRDGASAGSSKITVRARALDDEVEIAVEDDGPGIAPELVQRVFEPFFTTKEVGKGTGLGLSVSHGIVVDHGGRIGCESIEPHGARFVLRLPRADAGRPM